MEQDAHAEVLNRGSMNGSQIRLRDWRMLAVLKDGLGWYRTLSFCSCPWPASLISSGLATDGCVDAL